MVIKNKLLQSMDKFGEKIRLGFTKRKALVSPGMQDTKCKQSYHGKINRKVCKNNCKHYNRQERKCKLGYEI